MSQNQILTRRTGLFGERNAGKNQQTSKQVHTVVVCGIQRTVKVRNQNTLGDASSGVYCLCVGCRVVYQVDVAVNPSQTGEKTEKILGM